MKTRRIIIALVGLAVVVWLGWSALTLWTASEDARSGLDSLQDLDSMAGSSPAEIVDLVVDGEQQGVEAQTIEDLRAAASHFRSAREHASAPWLAPLEHVPVLGRQIQSVQHLSAAAETVAASSADAFERVDVALEGSFDDPAARTAAVRAVGESLEALRGDLHGLDLGPIEKLVAPLAEARDDFAAQLASLQDALDRAAPAALGTAEFLEGPSSYLFMAANNAEMRAGSGMFLQAGELAIANGSFGFGQLEATQYMVLDQPGTALDPDVAANWTWLSPDREFRNVNVTPRFEESARMAAEMWSSSGRGALDGVMVADVFALRSLLEVVGPVDVPPQDGSPGLTVDADDVVGRLLFEQYVEFEGERDARRDLEGRVAAAVLDAVNTRDVSPFDLLQAIDDAVSGRHLLLWSADPHQEEVFEAIGADGRLHGDDLAVALINRGGNKLDQFVDSTVTVTPLGRPAEGRQAYRLDVAVTNDAPEGLPSYIGGPYPGSGQPEGVWQGIVAVTLPAAADGMATDAPLVVWGNDGPSRVAGIATVVPRGSGVQVSLEFDLPTDSTTVRLMASARPIPSTWSFGGEGSAEDTTDARGQLVDLGTGS